MMEKRDDTQRLLLENFEKLTAIERSLVRICAIADEPVGLTSLFKIFNKSRLHPDVKFHSGQEMEPFLKNVIKLGLLDGNYQVPGSVKEIIARSAVKAGIIHRGDRLLVGVSSPAGWEDDASGKTPCFSCNRTSRGAMFHSPLGPLCAECVLGEIRWTANRIKAESWTADKLSAALAPDADIETRLTAISKFPGWCNLFSPYTHKDLLSLLVRNMGYADSHPLASAVRREALQAVTEMRYAMLDALLAADRRETWQLNANVVLALAAIAPEREDVRAILQETAYDPVPETRRILVSALNTLSYFPWAIATIEKMTGDTDPETRALAINALAGIRAKRKGLFPYRHSEPEGYSQKNGPSVRFGLVVREIQKEYPVTIAYLSSINDKVCRRIMRDLRIAILGDDQRLMDENYRNLSKWCGKSASFNNPLLQICDNPFDEEWFNSLSENTRLFILPEFFYHTLVNLKPETGALAAVMKAPFFKEATSDARRTALYYLAMHLTLSGRSAEALRILSEIDTQGFSFGIKGIIHFVEGRIEESVESFKADILKLQSMLAKKKINLSGIEGIFCIMAMLASRNHENWKRAETLLEYSLALKNDLPFRPASFRSLLGVLMMRKLEMDKARELLAREALPDSPPAVLIHAIAAFWVNGSLAASTLGRLESLYRKAVDSGISWAAMEAAALLLRAGGQSPEKRDFLEQIQKQTGMRSFVMTIEKEEPWRKSLHALIEMGKAPEGPASSRKTGETRMIWMVRNLMDRLEIQPMEQKTTASGAWSKGRAVALKRIFERSKLDFATKEDLAICAAIRNSSQYYSSYYFSMDLLLPALVGHPRLFLMDSPLEKAEFVWGEPEIVVSRNGSMLLIKPAAKLPESDFMLVEETPTRFKVIKITPEYRRIAGILGREGLHVPESAGADVMASVAAISSFALVHSDIGGAAETVTAIAADATPHVHLLPSGPGFMAEVFVKPFNEHGGPLLKPGTGAANIIAEINGTRMQTKRDLQSEKQMAERIAEVSPTFAELSDDNRKAYIDDPEDCLQILLDLKTLQEQHGVIVAWPEGEKLKVSREFSSRNLQLGIRSGRDWFEVSGSLRVDENLTLDMKRLLELLQTHRRFIPLEDGAFLALTAEFRKRLAELDIYTQKRGKELRLHPLAALSMLDMDEEFSNLTVCDAWRKQIERIREGQQQNPVVPNLLAAELRDYQEEGYRWLARLAWMGIGACLADDMGLGKTIQSLALLLQRASLGPSLVVAPTSVCWNWSAEAARFAPTLNLIQFTGDNRQGLVEDLHPGDVLVTSYGLLVQEEELLASVDWNVVILDEAQAIKNVATKRFQAAVKLKGSFRMATTGTPIQNHLDELWALFGFINPGLLGGQEQFNARFAIPIEKHDSREARARLKKLIQPFILRRLKSQVLDELPSRTEIVLQVDLTREEKAFYEALRRQAIEKIEADSAPVYMKQLKILAEITKLRQAACHPRLVMPETTIPSSKLALFGEVVEELLENRHKALVFSQFVRHLNLIREYLDEKKIGYRYLDGSTSPADRKRAVDAFQAGEGDLFLISLKAGGLGLNLTAADYVIHMDPWWNPSVEDQASDRAHRIGQQRPVTIYRLVAKNTIEERIVTLHQEKRDLAGSLLDGTDISGKISAEELIRLIREG